MARGLLLIIMVRLAPLFVASEVRLMPRAAPILRLAEVGTAAFEKKDVAADSPVLKLNANIFHGNVLRGSDRVDSWVVLYCPEWWEPCQMIQHHFAARSAEWDSQLNGGALLTLQSRFARVDCATDKPLCNERGVESYPTVQHFAKGQLVASWEGGRKSDAESLAKFLQGRLDGILTKATAGASEESGEDNLMSSDLLVDCMVILLVLGANHLAVSRNPNLWQRALPNAKPLLDMASASPHAASHLAIQRDGDVFLPKARRTPLAVAVAPAAWRTPLAVAVEL